MNIALVGCGYVADFYLATIKNYPELEIRGVYDHNTERLKNFCATYDLIEFDSLEELITQTSIDIVVNLTNPESHFQISKAALNAKKHVYSEKPIAMSLEEAIELKELAIKKGLLLSCAPCNLLSPSSQALKRAINEDLIGKILLVYASFDAGFTSQSDPSSWINKSGASWPLEDEYKVGCTFQHSGYILTLFASFFGSAERILSYSTVLDHYKNDSGSKTPDYSVGSIEYQNGTVVRLTNSLRGPLDRSLTLIGEKGRIYVEDIRDDNSPILYSLDNSYSLERINFRLRFLHSFLKKMLFFFPYTLRMKLNIFHEYGFLKSNSLVSKMKPVDFCRGISQLEKAINNKEEPLLSTDLAIQVLELTIKLQFPEVNPQPVDSKINLI